MKSKSKENIWKVCVLLCFPLLLWYPNVRHFHILKCPCCLRNALEMWQGQSMNETVARKVEQVLKALAIGMVHFRIPMY